MKKTFMAMLLVGGSMSLFAQNTQTGTTTNQGSTTTNQQTTTGTTQQSTGTTGDSSTQTGGNVSNMSNSATGTTGTMNNGANGTWNGVSANSTSWTPEKDPSWNWNSNGIWSGSANWNSNPNASANGSGSMNNNTTGNMNADGSMNSSGSYNAYAGSPVAGLPMNVQMRFNQDFPTGVNNTYSWNQYGDWFHTHQLNNGRLMQYFYNTRGDGYALALPVIQSYVPENIISSAIQKYGTNLYSISMVKPADTATTGAYQIGLIQGGQLTMQYLDENGSTVSNVWRVDSVDSSGTMNSTQANAAMDANSTMGQGMNNSQSSGMNNSQSSDMNNSQSSGTKESKIKMKHADGTETKIKTKNGKTKIKHDD